MDKIQDGRNEGLTGVASSRLFSSSVFAAGVLSRALHVQDRDDEGDRLDHDMRPVDDGHRIPGATGRQVSGSKVYASHMFYDDTKVRVRDVRN